MSDTLKISVTYSTVDHYHERRQYTTLAAARRFAQKWLGHHPEIGSSYAISDDGVGKITVIGSGLADLFPEKAVANQADERVS